ncbi:PIN domain-containing protein [Azospirillum brasilense]|uniref:PIN domain-containing protein n=1 Tax=Azospirillum brasilense TaxID=192 RepID=A0A6L3B3C9_AZOBR|nr:type II toxin-antitoxin system VapC family toxin [Azospirillum brasilense]KAA0687006.1 PIN domain-containing protein [Azospirillum brasilense]
MIGLDTNALVRLVIKDDAEQADLVRTTVRRIVADGKRCFVNRIALVEFVWVMESVYDQPRAEISRFIEAFLENGDLCIEDREAAQCALDRYRDNGADFSDALMAIGNQDAGCSTTLTFDRKAARLPEFQILS